MKSIFWSGKANYVYLLFIVLALGACKKSKIAPEPDPTTPSAGANTKQTPTTNRRELTSDSIFLYAKQIYYWNTTLPDYDTFDPRSYSTLGSDLANYNNELFNITKYSTYETVPGVNGPKYAYITDDETSNGSQASLPGTAASVDLTDTGYDMGFLFFSYDGTNSDYEVYVNAVHPNSPAAKAGITRGTRLTKIGNLPIGTNFNAQVGAIEGVLRNNINSLLVSGIRPDNTTFNDVSLTVSKYTSSPVYGSKVISQGGKNIGYLAYGRFSRLTTPSNTPSDTRLDPVFASFAASNVTELVIDLRYNGGGSVETAEYLTNLIAPSTAQGLMFQEVYNNTMKTGKATILKNQPLTDSFGKILYSTSGKMYTLDDVDWSDEGNRFNFSKKGQLGGVKNIVFLVSGNTASASELLINSIKPHVQSVKLVGKKTYGKPVGFFPVFLEGRYNVYIPSFESKNSRGEGGYYTGMTPDFLDDDNGPLFDDYLHDFGDPKESYLNKALAILAPVSTATSSSRMSSVGIGSSAVPRKKSTLRGAPVSTDDKGMVETRLKLKK